MSEETSNKPDQFDTIGGRQVAYVRPMMAGEARDLFPSMPEVAPDLKLWALLTADGTPIMLADTREAVMMNAEEHDLEAVNIH